MPLAKDHPWLVFDLKVSAFGPVFWSRLGAVAAMARQIGAMPLLPEENRRLHELLLARSALASAAIEDNFTAEQEIRRLEEGEKVAESYADVEISNLLELHRAAMDKDRIWQPSPEWLCQTNAKVLAGAALKERVRPGEIRQHQIGVGEYRGPDHCDCRPLLDSFGEFFAVDKRLWTRLAEEHGEYAGAIIRATLAHLYIAWIHPFGDGNGRTARMAEFSILASAGLPMAIGCCLSRHYHQSRPEYYAQLRKSSRQRPLLGDAARPAGFIYYAVSGLHAALKRHIEELQAMQQGIFFDQLLEERFDESSARHRRHKKLIRAIDRAGRQVRQDEIPSLTAELALMYERRTPKTLSRDLHSMTAAGWLRRSGRAVYCSNRQQILQRFQSPQAALAPETGVS